MAGLKMFISKDLKISVTPHGNSDMAVPVSLLLNPIVKTPIMYVSFQLFIMPQKWHGRKMTDFDIYL